MPQSLLPAALVTGGAVRIGRTLVTALAGLGFAVAIHCRRSVAAGEALAREVRERGGRAAVVAADLTEPVEVSGLVDAAALALEAPIGVLVNSAASFDADQLATLEPARLRRQLAVNLEAPLLLAQAYVAALPPDRPGLIVNIGDQRVANPTPSYLGYSVSKAGLDMATRVLARELAPRIRVVTLALGQALRVPGMSAARHRRLVAATPLQRVTGQDEIRRALELIVQSPSMTGSTLTLDSGMAMGWAYPGKD
jgi:NAD(P)-dependent dehydrogenase (short-subunit alcohol dehydrogenase family)